MSTKDIVLRHLLEVDGESFISGQELAEKCGISRQAVWKAVEALRKDNVQIQAVTNSGYKLESLATDSETNVLSESVINSLLPADICGKAIVLQDTDSTNLEAKRLYTAGTKKISELCGTAIVADSQTAGRGRLGREFFSPKGSGLYISIIFVPEKTLTAPEIFTASAAVAVCRAIKNVYDKDAQIKWVNDIFMHGKKICGILTEGVTNFETGTIDYLVVGIGVNVLPQNFPRDIAQVATSIFEHDMSNKGSAKRNQLAAAIISETLQIFSGGQDAFCHAMTEYRQKSFLIGKKITVSPIACSDKNQFEATVLDVTETAKLVVKKNDGTQLQLDSGEVTLHRAN